jgi:hypothetical protein
MVTAETYRAARPVVPFAWVNDLSALIVLLQDIILQKRDRESRSAAARKLNDAINVRILAGGDARHREWRLQRADQGFIPKAAYCRLWRDDSATAILNFSEVLQP